MAQRRRKVVNERLTYWCIGLINACVAVMFTTILWPRPVVPALVANSSVVSIHHKPAPIRPPITGTPTRVQVPSVGIDTGVQPGSYDTQSNTWTIDTSSAFYATVTVPVNNTNGTTLIYGHAGWGIFENLPKVSEGAQAFVYASDGTVFVYDFVSNRQVSPSDVSFLTSDGPPQLVLQTCSGAFDSYRTLITFRLNGVRKNA